MDTSAAALAAALVAALIENPALIRSIAAAIRATRADAILRLPDVLRRTGLTRSTLYSRIADGSFPPQVILSNNVVGWHESEVDAWIANRSKHARAPRTA